MITRTLADAVSGRRARRREVKRLLSRGLFDSRCSGEGALLLPSSFFGLLVVELPVHPAAVELPVAELVAFQRAFVELAAFVELVALLC